MGKLIVPRHTADLEYIIPALEVYYEEKDWVSTSVYKDKLFEKLKANKKETVRNSDETHYTKCSEIPRYFGLLEREFSGKSSSNVRITESGKSFYEAFVKKDYNSLHAVIMNALEKVRFGRNNEGCGSDTNVEAPNAVIISMLLLDGISNKEAAFVLGGLNDKKDSLYSSILKLKVFRESHVLDISSTVTTDMKFIPFLKRINFLSDNDRGLSVVSDEVIEKYRSRLIKLRILNDEEIVGNKDYDNCLREIGDDVSHPNLLTALRTKPFLLLAGISGTGKSRIVRELAFASCPEELQDKDGTTPGNYCMIEVKPNWHDSSELLGYYSNISKKYIFTKFVKFLVKAKMYPTVPFFVCLDEMNLAPVEQYFAEFLSVLETRKKVDGVIKTGALVDANWFSKSYELFDPFVEVGLDKIGQEVSTMEVEKAQTSVTTEQYDRQDIVDDLKEHGLTLPDNVFVIGTVNMDDTTHQFSRKVIDRAMTIEMNGGDLMDMFGGSAKLSYLEEKDVLPLEVFRPRYVNADEVLAAHQDCEEQVRKQTTKWLGSINACLKSTPFEVSYRVLNELVIYLGNLLDENNYQGKGEDDEFKALVDTAVDRITLMKILPRVEGDEDMFEVKGDTKNRLEKLQELFTSSTSKDTTPTLSKDEDENSEDANESENTPSSHEKLQYMIERLESGFTRFWP